MELILIVLFQAQVRYKTSRAIRCLVKLSIISRDTAKNDYADKEFNSALEAISLFDVLERKPFPRRRKGAKKSFLLYHLSLLKPIAEQDVFFP